MCRTAIAYASADRGFPFNQVMQVNSLNQTDMLLLLLQLQDLLDRCQDGRADDPDLQQLCLHLQHEVPRAFKTYTDPAIAAGDFARYHRGLVGLYTCVLAQGDPPVSAAVGRLLHNHEALFADLIAPNEPLPDFHTAALAEAVSHEWAYIQPRLGDKGVPAAYLAEIGHAWDALFMDGKVPAPAYHHRQYLPEFLGMLRQLADDPRDKDWPKRFTEALVNYNFNYMGFFNRWKEACAAEFAAASQTGGAPQLLSEWFEILQHHAPLPGLAFIPERAPLLEHMARYVTSKAAGLLDGDTEQEAASSNAIKTTLNSKMQAMDFRYRYKKNYYDYRNMEEAAKAYSASQLSKTGRHISAHSLQRFDTVELEDTVHRYLQDLAEMIKEIRRDFKL